MDSAAALLGHLLDDGEGDAVTVNAHLYGLSVVDLYNVETEAIDPPPRSLEHAGFEVEMVADVH